MRLNRPGLLDASIQGVIENDPEREIVIPTTLEIPLQVRSAYNGERIFFQYR